MPTETWSAAAYREWLRTGREPGTSPPEGTPPQSGLEPGFDPGSGELTEDELQRDVARFLETAAPEAFHIPNGGKRRRIEAAILRGRGVKAGVPDWCVPLAGGRCGWIELKTDEGGLSDAQRAFHGLLKALEHDVVIARSVAAVEDALRRWGRIV